MENVDKTIDVICDWIQKELKSGKSDTNHTTAEMVKALAELISARG